MPHGGVCAVLAGWASMLTVTMTKTLPLVAVCNIAKTALPYIIIWLTCAVYGV